MNHHLQEFGDQRAQPQRSISWGCDCPHVRALLPQPHELRMQQDSPIPDEMMSHNANMKDLWLVREIKETTSL